ncbi:MAG TPA: matrixin family metalloprotease [candidate division Zixibacteria bacterium]|nr:matrixin family metalloprotease [candidate division Zixibacteria bacterium]
MPVFINSVGEPSAPSGGFQQVRTAYQAWSTVIGSTFRFLDGGLTSAQGFAFDGVNAVSFRDPLGQLDPPEECSGVLAAGGFFRSTQETRTVNGQTFFRILEGDVVFNDGWEGCGFYESFNNLTETATHELGHVLGLGHSENEAATMFEIAHFDGRGATLHSDDVAGVNVIYPKNVAAGQIQYADVDGDGRADGLYFDTFRSKSVWLSLSTGAVFEDAVLWLP